MALAQDQLDTFLEFYAAWWPLTADYVEAREQAERLLAGRKALRDFTQTDIESWSAKSPLDPTRDCVLKCLPSGATPEVCRVALRLKSRETLDAVSLLKRLLNQSVTPSTSLMAARAYISGGVADTMPEWADLKRIADGTGGAIDPGDLLFEERLTADEMENLGIDKAEVNAAACRTHKETGYAATLLCDPGCRRRSDGQIDRRAGLPGQTP